ncbi:Hypothetical protein FKW44_023518 [Caligus rogercresseyi]|uniref:Uncharacterized protein n=1 Tax=Caligus rogercresseyi TaxID=217165 RepID=A0A7T8JUT7_CALRO|nr:Hypothetical protein FKW44_023518 [Caligus rogercresseyi]
MAACGRFASRPSQSYRHHGDVKCGKTLVYDVKKKLETGKGLKERWEVEDTTGRWMRTS